MTLDEINRMAVFNTYFKDSVGDTPNCDIAKFLEELIIDAINSGMLAKGQKLTARTPWADNLGINSNILNAACTKLADDGYLVTGERRSTRVNSEPVTLEEDTDSFYCSSSSIQLEPIPEPKYCKDRLHILKMGQWLVNPSLLISGKSNPIITFMKILFSWTLAKWHDYQQQRIQVSETILKEHNKNRYRLINSNQIIWGIGRKTTLENAFRPLPLKGVGVILDDKMDRLIHLLLVQNGAKLFYVSCTKNGFCLDEVRALIGDKANNIEFLYSNPFRESFCNASGIFERRYALRVLLNKKKVFLIEEFSEDFLINSPAAFVKATPVTCCSGQISIRSSSIFSAEMHKIFTITGSNAYINRYKEMKIEDEPPVGIDFTISEHVLSKAMMGAHDKEIDKCLIEWRERVAKAAELYLSEWFDLVEGDKGTSMWLHSKSPEGVMIAMNALDSIGMDISHSHGHSNRVRVQALDVGIGYGEIVQIIEVFKQINLDLTPHKGIKVLTN